MTAAEALTALQRNRTQLFEMGIAHAAIFGSTARGEESAGSDLDLAIKLRPDMRLGWDYFTLDDRVGKLLGIDVDLVSEPARRARLQDEIDRDRIDAF